MARASQFQLMPESDEIAGWWRDGAQVLLVLSACTRVVDGAAVGPDGEWIFDFGIVVGVPEFPGIPPGIPYARTGGGNIEPLHGEMTGAFRLRLGDYRVLFSLQDDAMRIFGVRHRSQAYR